MAIEIEQISKSYGHQQVLANVSLRVEDGELVVLLGPSGSGKSTLLRILAGLTGHDAGRVRFGVRDVSDLPPQKRDVGFVFQSYALFRSMTVAENVEFPLTVRGVGKRERRARRDELLELVGLAGLGQRQTWQLSGGQQQRVALARALAHRPKVLLLDEPFGALDAKIRAELRQSVRAIQRELAMTTLFVTHDQEEAFELADRIAVMSAGRLLEVAPGPELYARPETELVATFLGSANLLVGQCDRAGVHLGEVSWPLATQVLGAPEAVRPRRVQVLFRPEDVALSPERARLEGECLGEGTVEQRVFLGPVERLRLRLPPLPATRAVAPAPPFGVAEILVDAARPQHLALTQPLAVGDRVWVGVRRVHVLPHPGLSLLAALDPTRPPSTALEHAVRLVELAQARLAVCICESNGQRTDLEALRERLGVRGGVELVRRAAEAVPALAGEAVRRRVDLVLHERGPASAEAVVTLLEEGEHHVLLVPAGAALPRRLVVCVAVGEPGKGDVLFAGRLARHLAAPTEVLTVLSPSDDDGPAERFLAASCRSLAALGVEAAAVIERGPAFERIVSRVGGSEPPLLVLGAPLVDARGRRSLEGLVGRLLENVPGPVLVVRQEA